VSISFGGEGGRDEGGEEKRGAIERRPQGGCHFVWQAEVSNNACCAQTRARLSHDSQADSPPGNNGDGPVKVRDQRHGGGGGGGIEKK